MTTGDEAFVPAGFLQSKDSQEAWIALTSHRHLLELGRKVASLGRAHSHLHMFEPLMDEETFDTLHTEILDETQEVMVCVERAKLAIWN